MSLTKSEAIPLALLRIVIGWMMFYAGISKIMNSAWTAKGYLLSAKTFPELYQWLASDANMGWVNFVNEWGLTLLGVSLILGIGVRLSSILGIGIMVLYYLPILEFPNVAHGIIVDEHVIYASALAFFAVVRAGRYYGLESWCENLPICKQFPGLHKFWG